MSRSEYYIYDNGCSLSKHLQTQGDDYFDGCAFPIDVFHFKSKHKETDTFCMQNCNPMQYVDLTDEDGNWTFNTSIAEQTNVWLGGFHAVVREMVAERYNFFLDEMVKRRNRWVISELERKGKRPGIISRDKLGVSGVHPMTLPAVRKLFE
jgi:hypothetical protein